MKIEIIFGSAGYGKWPFVVFVFIFILLFLFLCVCDAIVAMEVIASL